LIPSAVTRQPSRSPSLISNRFLRHPRQDLDQGGVSRPIFIAGCFQRDNADHYQANGKVAPYRFAYLYWFHFFKFAY
jgi:hypothetical protein